MSNRELSEALTIILQKAEIEAYNKGLEDMTDAVNKLISLHTYPADGELISKQDWKYVQKNILDSIDQTLSQLKK